MSEKAVIRLLNVSDSLLPDARVSAVFLIGFREGKIVSIRNERGWDVPGGHVEPGESPEEALRREVMEEAGASFVSAIPFAILETPPRTDVMLFFVAPKFDTGAFVPGADTFDRAELLPEASLVRYHGDTTVLRRLIEHAKIKLGGTAG